MKETKIVKVKLKKGSVYTINISNKTFEFIEGTDKFGCPIKVCLDDIESMYPISGTQR